MSVSWYDLLDVAPGADTDEIRAAWKAAIADLEPTDRRFRLCNDAAAVLLDPEQRAAYDAQLARDEAAAVAAVAAETDEPAGTDETAEPPAQVAAVETAGPADVPVETPAAAPRRTVPGWLLLALAATVLLVGGSGLGVGAWLEKLPWQSTDVEAAISQARQAATRQVPLALSYDYTKLEESHDKALSVLAGDQRKEFEEFWEESIAPNLTQRKATNKAEVLNTAVVRADDDGERVELVTVVTATFSNADTSGKQTLTITIRMVEQDGEWLIEDIEGGSPENPQE